MRSDYVTTPHGVEFADPIDGYVAVCRRPAGHAGDCAIEPQPADLTLTESIAYLMGTFPNPEGPVHRVATFAHDCSQMLDSLSVVSFPFTGAVQISTTDPHAELYITEGTARLLHTALGRALGLPSAIVIRGDR